MATGSAAFLVVDEIIAVLVPEMPDQEYASVIYAASASA